MNQPILAIDLYSGNYNPPYFHLPLEEMRSHGFRLAIVKASMGGGVDGIDLGKKGWLDTPSIYRDLFRGAGLDFGLYHWLDPIRTADYQFQWFRDQIGRLDPDCIAIDDEQWWASWAEYYEAINHQRAWGDVTRLAPAKIDSCSAATIDLLDEYRKPTVPLELYTFCTFFRTYAGADWPPAIADRTRNPWLACHPTVAKEYQICETWAEFDEYLERFVVGRSPIALAGAPLGLTTWRWWQFASTILLPGASEKIDLSIFNGSEAEYELWLRGPQAPSEPQTALQKFFDLLRQIGAGIKSGTIGK
jgi:hypothetical protein